MPNNNIDLHNNLKNDLKNGLKTMPTSIRSYNYIVTIPKIAIIYFWPL